MLRFYPHRQAKQMRLEQYREAWHQVLPAGKKDAPIDIYAMAEEELPELTWLTPRPNRT